MLSLPQPTTELYSTIENLLLVRYQTTNQPSNQTNYLLQTRTPVLCHPLCRCFYCSNVTLCVYICYVVCLHLSRILFTPNLLVIRQQLLATSPTPIPSPQSLTNNISLSSEQNGNKIFNILLCIAFCFVCLIMMMMMITLKMDVKAVGSFYYENFVSI